MNFLALNIANDIATGTSSVEDAQKSYTEAVIAFTKGDKPPYTQKLQFSVPKGGTGDRDKSTIKQ